MFGNLVGHWLEDGVWIQGGSFGKHRGRFTLLGVWVGVRFLMEYFILICKYEGLHREN